MEIAPGYQRHQRAIGISVFLGVLFTSNGASSDIGPISYRSDHFLSRNITQRLAVTSCIEVVDLLQILNEAHENCSS